MVAPAVSIPACRPGSQRTISSVVPLAVCCCPPDPLRLAERSRRKAVSVNMGQWRGISLALHGAAAATTAMRHAWRRPRRATPPLEPERIRRARGCSHVKSDRQRGSTPGSSGVAGVAGVAGATAALVWPGRGRAHGGSVLAARGRVTLIIQDRRELAFGTSSLLPSRLGSLAGLSSSHWT